MGGTCSHPVAPSASVSWALQAGVAPAPPPNPQGQSPPFLSIWVQEKVLNLCPWAGRRQGPAFRGWRLKAGLGVGGYMGEKRGVARLERQREEGQREGRGEEAEG